MTTVLVACSARKRLPAAAFARDLPSGGVEEVGRVWLDRLEGTPSLAARTMYAGRGSREAVAAADALRASLLFASAGLGLVRADAPVPSYGMTVAPGPDCVLSRVGGLAPERWWSWLAERSPWATCLDAVFDGEGPVVVSLPYAYLAMLAPALEARPDGLVRRLRLLVRPASVPAASKLAAQAIVYDDRFDGPDSPLPGTRADAAGRRARHFAGTVLSREPAGSVVRHAAMVGEDLARMRPPARTANRSADDPTLREAIRAGMGQVGNRAAPLLRHLRDAAGLACEQSRFARLLREVREGAEAA